MFLYTWGWVGGALINYQVKKHFFNKIFFRRKTPLVDAHGSIQPTLKRKQKRIIRSNFNIKFFDVKALFSAYMQGSAYPDGEGNPCFSDHDSVAHDTERC